MIMDAQDLARQTFQAALWADSPRPPESLLKYLAQVANGVNTYSVLIAEALEQELEDEFPFLRSLIGEGIAPDGASIHRWQRAVCWILRALRDWGASSGDTLDSLRMLLVAGHLLDVHSAGLESVATQVATHSLRLKEGLGRLVEASKVAPQRYGQYQGMPEFRDVFRLLTQQGNYEHVQYLLQNLMPDPQSDLWAAIVLQWKLEPERLANVVVDKDDVLFSLFVCFALRDSIAQFALHVPLVSFKFISIYFLLNASVRSLTSPDWEDVARELLLQVAETSYWSAWMQTLFKHPDSESLMGRALAKALVRLEEKHWGEFIGALSLDHSRGAAESVANILTVFANEVGAEKASPMWRIAFQVWDVWNYAKREEKAYLFAPNACALDYPVVMYYAQLPAPELCAGEAKLKQEMENMEQQWFGSLSDLITERNRLLSRLRLVQQALAVVSGAATQGLPPPVQPSEDLYARVRYREHGM